MAIIRPDFARAWQLFSAVNVPVKQVGGVIGGKVKTNIDSGIFTNACPIRMSYVLNRTNVPIPGPSAGYAVSSGADGKWYMYRVSDMIRFLKSRFGTPDKVATTPAPNHFTGMKGIIVVEGTGWSDATGHVTLFNGAGCQDSCHLTGDPTNGSFRPQTGTFWKLP